MQYAIVSTVPPAKLAGVLRTANWL